MRNKSNRSQWLLYLGLVFGLSTTALTYAAQAKGKLDLDAEAKQSEQEDADQAKERLDGNLKSQRVFSGKFSMLSEGSHPDLSPEVVGSFETNAADKKPGRTYLVKVEAGDKLLLDALKHVDGKNAQVRGKLRVIGPDGEAKYIIISSITEMTTTPRRPERGLGGGL